MGALIDLTGRTFGRLRVVSRAPNSKAGKAMWNCICVEGSVIAVLGASLIHGKTQSCGCLMIEKTAIRSAENRAKDKSGHVYGYLFVMSSDGVDKLGRKTYLCECNSPLHKEPKYVSIPSANVGKTQSCGCIAKASAADLCRILALARTGKKCKPRSQDSIAKQIATCAANKAAREAAALPKWKTPRSPKLEMTLLERLALGLEE